MQAEFKDLGTALFGRLKELQSSEKGETLPISEISNVIESVINSFEISSRASGISDEASKEIHNILSRLKQTRDDVASAGPVMSADKITDANKNLSEVVKETESAANSIMDAADAIQNLAGGAGEEIKNKIMEETNKIFEACNFQDLTGQRIKKVIKTLEYVEVHAQNLARIMGIKEDEVVSYDKSLMDGPQLEGLGHKQDDVDQLFKTA